ncbi:hypothetical protein ACHQM5_015898 [Ranunculus cassubicifolius]
MSFATAAIPTLPPLGGVSLGGTRQTRTNAHVRAFKSGRLSACSLKQPGFVFSKFQTFFDGKFQTRRTTGRANQMQSAAAICASAYNSRCAVAEPLTVSRSANMVASAPSKQTMPLLDDGGGSGGGLTGTKTKPYYRGGGGGGGGNGNFPTSRDFPWGDYWFFIFLLLLRFLLMNIIREGTCVYKYEDGRNKPIRRYAH